jgi:sensor histidine kinase YesM
MIKILGRSITLVQFQWLIWFLVVALTFGSYLQTADLFRSVIYAVVNVLCTIMIVYGNAYWLMPRLYQQGKKIMYILAVLLLLIIICMGRVQFRSFILRVFYSNETDQSSPAQVYITIFVSCIMTFLFSIAFRLALDYFTVRKEQEQLKQYTAEVELNLLKAQVQPHFLFNTLNNIYYVAQRQSPETADLLAKLSNIMRYFVDEGPSKEIFLETEISFIRDYIDLEKMRMRHPLQLGIHIEGNANQVRVPPMLLIPLVENVFKHGIDKRSAQNELLLHIKMQADSLCVEVRNRLFKQHAVTQNGSGLQNLRARLQLLYGNRFQLHTIEKEDYFVAQLNIPL